MAFGNCTICRLELAKYKCPKCSVEYCSLKCFKSADHLQTHESTITKDVLPNVPSISVEHELKKEEQNTTKFQDVFQDDQIKYMLSFPALKIHLFAIYEILTNMTLTLQKRMDMANDKLNTLRTAGAEENELVEEFCQRVSDLLLQEKK